MKKIISILLLALIFTGCSDLSNTPTKKAESFLKKYQMLDSTVLSDLDETLENNTIMNGEQKDEYKKIMKKHYQNLAYEVKDETINGDEAIVEVEITVTDFNKVLDEATVYLSDNIEEFYDENGEYSKDKFMDYRLQKLSDAKEKVKYTIEIPVSKVDEEWTVHNITEEIYSKINGTYNY